MTRFALVIPFCLMALPAVAQDKQTLCTTSAEIVDTAVTARADGAKERAVIRDITGTLDGDKAVFKPAVEPIVNWVYTLPEDQLTDEVATVYKDTCLKN